ncbi:MAG: aldo/keto reductase [Prochlorothrix sp.]
MGCGTWAWGNRLLWGYDETADPELQRVFNACVRGGATLFDTGDSYGTGKLNGQSEKLLGRFSQDYGRKLPKTFCIATKLAAYPWRLTRGAMVKAGLASADRLGRSADLVQMHWPTTNYAPWQERALLDGLGDLWEQGQVKAVGLSNYGPKTLRKVHQRFRDRNIPLVTLQIQYSLLSIASLPLQELQDTCGELGVQIIAYSPLTLGLLTGKYRQPTQLPQGLRGLLFRQLLPSAQQLLGPLDELARTYDKTPAQIALNWCLCQGTIPIPGAKNLAQAQENLGALGWRLKAADVETLTSIALQIQRPMVKNVFQTR